MLRKLNFTERGKVPRSQVHFRLRREADDVLAFDPAISFEGLEVPPDARVYIEAWHRTSFMRFDCGSVAAPAVPADRRLTGIDGNSIRFRIKIVDAKLHRILAIADDIRVTERAPEPGDRTPLLPVQFTDALDQQPWRISFEPDTPVLELNNRIDGIERLARDDAFFFALVYPAAVRMILTQILLVDGHDVFEDSSEWWSLWIRWASRHTSAPPPADSDDAPGWIDEVVASFSAQHRLVDRINQESGETS